MRARSSIPALLCAMWAAGTACDTSPTGMLDPGGAALLVVAPSAATLRGGAKLQLHLSAHDETGQTARPSGVVWTTSNGRIAAVAQDGVVTGGDPGSAQITAWWSGVHGTSSLTVTIDPGPPNCGGGGDNKAADLALEKVCVAR